MFLAPLLFRLFFLLVTGMLTVACLYTWLTDYENFVQGLATATRHPDKVPKFRLLLPPERFFLIRILFTFASGVAAVLTVFLWQKTGQLTGAIRGVTGLLLRPFLSFRTLWKGIPQSEKIGVTALWLVLWAAQVFIAFRLPFHIDERFTYLYFVREGWLVSMVYYPGPNNHILFTLLCNLTDLFLEDPFLVMKVTALAAGGLLPPVFWAVVRSQSRASEAWLATLLLGSSEKTLYYATQGRGYSLLAIWVAVAAFCALRISRGPARKDLYLWLGISCVLGFYTIPTFLYPFAGLVVYLVIKISGRRQYEQLKFLSITLLASLAATCLLYLPVVVVNGWQALTANAWVAPLPGSDFARAFPGYLTSAARGFWTGDGAINAWMTLGVVVLGSALVLGRKNFARDRQWATLLGVQLFVFGMIAAGQRVLPPERVLGYFLVFLYPVATAGILKGVQLLPLPRLSRLRLVFAGGGLFCLFALGRFGLHATNRPSDLYHSLDAVANLLYSRKATSVFTRDYEYSLCIRFRFETGAGRLVLETTSPPRGHSYQYVVVPRYGAFPENISEYKYRPVYRDN